MTASLPEDFSPSISAIDGVVTPLVAPKIRSIQKRLKVRSHEVNFFCCPIRTIQIVNATGLVERWLMHGW